MSSKPSINPTVRDHAEELMLAQTREGTYLATQLKEEALNQATTGTAKLLLEAIRKRLAENIGQLSHGLTGRYADGELEVPVRGAISEITGAVATMHAFGDRHPVTEVLRHTHGVLAALVADYTVLHTLALASSNAILADMCLQHLEAIKILDAKILLELPAAVELEYAPEDDELSGQIGPAAQDHIKATFA